MLALPRRRSQKRLGVWRAARTLDAASITRAAATSAEPATLAWSSNIAGLSVSGGIVQPLPITVTGCRPLAARFRLGAMSEMMASGR